MTDSNLSANMNPIVASLEKSIITLDSPEKSEFLPIPSKNSTPNGKVVKSPSPISPSAFSSLPTSSLPNSSSLPATTSSSSSSSRKSRQNLIQRFVSLYFHLLDLYPVLIKACTQASLSFLGNIIAQKFVKRQPKIDWRTIFVFTASNFCSSPLIHYWYKILRANVKNVPIALLLDQIPFQIVYTSYFYSMLRIFRDFNISQIPSDVKQNLFPTLRNSWKVWPLAQVVNLSFVPPKYNVLFGNMVGFFWSIILAGIAGKSK